MLPQRLIIEVPTVKAGTWVYPEEDKGAEETKAPAPTVTQPGPTVKAVA